MTLEFFKAVTPWLTLLVSIAACVLGFVLNSLIKRVEALTDKLHELDREHQIDQRKMHEKFVNKEAFYIAIGKQEGITGRIFDQINGLNTSVNQAIGAMRERDRK
jgi:hypothetical protein